MHLVLQQLFLGDKQPASPLLAEGHCNKIGAKSGVNLGGSAGRLRAFPFLRAWRALPCGEIFVKALDEAPAFIVGWLTQSHLAGTEQANRYAVCIAFDRCFSAARLV